MTGCQPYSDNVSRCRAPAYAPADASRREQRTKEAFTSASPVPPLLTSLNFSTTSDDQPRLSPSSNLRPLIGNAAMTSDMEHTSDTERNHALSHANNEARCTAVESHPASPVDTSKQQQQQKRASLSEAVKISVTKEKEDLISYSVHELSRVQSSPAPLPSLLPGLPSLSSPALHAQVHQSLSSPHFASPIAQRPLSTSPRTMTKNSKLKKPIHLSLQGESLHNSSYIVAGKRGDQNLTSDQNDSIEGVISEMDGSTQMTTETDMSGIINDKDKSKMSTSRSLSRKLSEKFRKDKSPDTTTSKQRTNTSKDVRTYLGSRSSPQMNENPSNIGNEDPSEIARGRERRREMGVERENSDRRMFPKMRRLFGGRSKSREMNEIYKPPSLPALPKHCMNDRYTAIYPPREQQKVKSSSLSCSHESNRLQFAKSASTSLSGRPSTATTPTRSSSSDAPSTSTLWNRSRSAGSLMTMFEEAPPMPSPLPDLRRYINDETDPHSKPRIWKDKHISDTIGTRSPHTLHAGAGGPYILHHDNMSDTVDIEKSDSPPIPLFSTAKPINFFPLKHSSGRPETKSASFGDSSTRPNLSAHINPMFGSSRPVQSVQRPEHAGRNSFGDEILYPPVIKKKDSSFRIMQKMTFRELNSSDPANRSWVLTEQEKADRWDALLKKSEAAGGTLHLRGVDDKLLSDELRFSKTLSELARDDESADII